MLFMLFTCYFFYICFFSTTLFIPFLPTSLFSDLKHDLEEEGARSLLLAKQRSFNEQCCIRCCGPFNIFLKPRHVCLDCHYNICKACCFYSQQENGYVCAFCHKSRSVSMFSLPFSLSHSMVFTRSTKQAQNTCKWTPAQLHERIYNLCPTHNECTYSGFCTHCCCVFIM